MVGRREAGVWGQVSSAGGGDGSTVVQWALHARRQGRGRGSGHCTAEAAGRGQCTDQSPDVAEARAAGAAATIRFSCSPGRYSRSLRLSSAAR